MCNTFDLPKFMNDTIYTIIITSKCILIDLLFFIICLVFEIFYLFTYIVQTLCRIALLI